MTKLRAEAHYLHEKLTSIVYFNGSTVDRENITDLESKILDMKIDFRAIDEYFVSETTKAEIDMPLSTSTYLPISNSSVLLL